MASNDCISVINPRSLQLCSNCKVSRRHKKSTRVRLKNCGLLCKQNRLKVSDSAKANVNTESDSSFQNCQYVDFDCQIIPLKQKMTIFMFIATMMTMMTIMSMMMMIFFERPALHQGPAVVDRLRNSSSINILSPPSNKTTELPNLCGTDSGPN